MRVLLATVSPAHYMAPPRLGDEQVVCGPDWKDERDSDGRWISLKTPRGDYNLAEIAAKLPASQKPDAVVCLVDASWRNTPRGLSAFKCPRVLLIADTHHLTQPIVGMLRYATSEPFTRIVLLYDRHHAGIFRSAGVKNLFWFPGLTLPHSDAVVRSARTRGARLPQVGFVGQRSQHHPRRSRLLDAMQRRGIDIRAEMIPQAEAARFYGRSLVGFNASLNGDLNLRVFEILASGAALLTDRLASDSGLAQLLSEECDVITYGSEDELVDRASHLLANPGEALAIGTAGASWFDTHFNESRRRAAFQSLAIDGTSVPEFALSDATTRVYFPGALDRLIRAVTVYEHVQEWHRTGEAVHVALTASVSSDVALLCETLPRVQCRPDALGGPADLVVMSRDDAHAPATETNRLWCWDAGAQGMEALAARLAGESWICTNPRVGLFERRVVSPLHDGRKHVLLYTDDPDSGGVAQYNHNVLLALARAGHRVSCVQTRCDNPLIAEQAAAGVTHHWLDYHTGKDFKRTLTDRTLAEKLFRIDPPDLILFSDCCPVSNLAAREAAWQMNLPYVCVIGFVGAYLAENFKIALPMLEKQHAAAAAVIAVSQENRDLLLSLFGTPAEKCEVIHYGRPEKFFAPRNEATRARLRAELGLPADAVVCLTTARLSKVKGFEHQLRAIHQLRGTPASRVLHHVWAGEGDQRAILEKEIARLGFKNRIHLIGHRWDVAEWYDAADMFVLPSHVEGMPLSIMEAMAKGLPVAASAVSGIPEELGETGRLLSDPGKGAAETEAQLAETLEEWTGSATLRNHVGASCAMRARGMFKEDLMIRRTLAALERAGLTMTAETSTMPIGHRD